MSAVRTRTLLVLVLCALLAPQAALGAPPPAPPNIVVLMIDDIAFMDHRVFERLPNIKATFMDQGVEAVNYWGNDPLCCPGRANFLTAQVAHVNGVTHNDALLLDPTETIATELDALGYYTNICGKYLNFTENLADKSPPGWDNVAIMSGSYYGYTAYVNNAAIPHGSTAADYSTDVFANHCLAFLRAAPANRPLFAFMTPYATHKGADEEGLVSGEEPAVAPRHANDGRCADIARWSPANYNPADLTGKPKYVRKRPLLTGDLATGYPLDRRCRSLLAVDDWLGRTTDLLRTQGRYDNTIFVLTADNGMGYGGFRWEKKGVPHVAQLPLFISWPSVVQGPPRRIGKLLTNVDLAPTLCEFAGCVMGPYPNGEPADGQSFAGMVAPTVATSAPYRRAVVLEDLGAGPAPIWRALMTDPTYHPSHKQWYYIEYKTGEKELYNLSGGTCSAWQVGMAGDPCMLTNLAYSKRKLRRSLAAELARLW